MRTQLYIIVFLCLLLCAQSLTTKERSHYYVEGYADGKKRAIDSINLAQQTKFQGTVAALDSLRAQIDSVVERRVIRVPVQHSETTIVIPRYYYDHDSERVPPKR